MPLRGIVPFCLVFLAVAHGAAAEGLTDPLTTVPLNSAWAQVLSKTGKQPSLQPGPKGLELKGDDGALLLLKRPSSLRGNDEHPLIAEVHAWSEPAVGPTGIHLYWAPDAFVSLGYRGGKALAIEWRNKSGLRRQDWERLPASTAEEGIWLRIVLTKKNLFCEASVDHCYWETIARLGVRPGPEGQGPALVLLGRGADGGAAELANDRAVPEPKAISSRLRGFRLLEGPLPASSADLSALKQEDWQAARKSAQRSVIPKQWTILGPDTIEMKDSRVPPACPPDQTDNWSPTPKNPKGKEYAVKVFEPKEQEDYFVNLNELLETRGEYVAFARTEIDWPEEGPAQLNFYTKGHHQIFLNNKQLSNVQLGFGAPREQSSTFSVRLRRGINVLKLKLRPLGRWGFQVGIMDNSPAFRIRLLEHLLEHFPEEARGRRGAEARLEIARLLEQLGNYSGALASCQAVLASQTGGEEYRVQAFEGTVRILELLQDWTALETLAGEHLKAFPSGPTAPRALQAQFLARVAGDPKLLAAQAAQMQAWLTQAGPNSERAVAGWRALAGVAERYGNQDERWKALETLAKEQAAGPREQAAAAFEAAFARLQTEAKAAPGNEPKPAPRAAICQAARTGLALLAGAGLPQVQRLVQEAQGDEKAGQLERAMAGYWAAAMLGLAGSHGGEAKPAVLGQAYEEPALQAADFKQAVGAYEAALRKADQPAQWQGAWQAIGPFPNLRGAGMVTAYPPEEKVDLAAAYPGKGAAQLKWVALDGKFAWEDGAGKLESAFAERTGGGLVYLYREFQLAKAGRFTLFLSGGGPWEVWVDGVSRSQAGGENWSADGRPIPLELEAGTHRFLLKLAQQDRSALRFRARFGSEPLLGFKLLSLAWAVRRFPQVANLYDSAPVLEGCLQSFAPSLSPPAILALGSTLSLLLPGDPALRWRGATLTAQVLRERGHGLESAQPFLEILPRLQTWAPYPGQTEQFWEAAKQSYFALRGVGDEQTGDRWLRLAAARHPDDPRNMAEALIYRATSRADFMQLEEARPVFERAVAEYANFDPVPAFGAKGLDFARGYWPERLQFPVEQQVADQAKLAIRALERDSVDEQRKAADSVVDLLQFSGEQWLPLEKNLRYFHYVGVREYFRSIIASLTEPKRAIYRERAEPSATERLKALTLRRQPADLAQIARTFPFTSSSALALNQAGNLYLDQGQYAEAADAFSSLLDDFPALPPAGIGPSPRPLLPGTLCAKWVWALIHDRQFAAARKALDTLAGEFEKASLTWQGQTLSGAQAAQRLEARLQQALKAEAPEDPPALATYLGGADRTGAPAETPALDPARPLGLRWLQPRIPARTEEAVRALYRGNPHTLTHPFPVARHAAAYFGGLDSLSAFDLTSGRPLWRQAWEARGTFYGDQYTGFPGSCPTLDEDRIYLRTQRGGRILLECFAAQDGALLWSSAMLPSTRNAFWLCDPLIYRGLAIAVYLNPSGPNEHGVAALNARTGALVWERPLVSGNTGVRVFRGNAMPSLQLGPPAALENRVYAQTGLASIAALDAASGDLLWIRGYLRMHAHSDERSNTGMVWGLQPQRNRRLFTRGPLSAIVTPQALVVAPKDAAGLVALDPLSGKPLWKHDLLNPRYLLGTSADQVLTGDETIRALDLKDGSEQWAYALDREGEKLEGQPGRAGHCLYLPGTWNLHILDARTGRRLGLQPWPAASGPLGNLLVLGDLLLGSNERWMAALAPAPNPADPARPQLAGTLIAQAKWPAAAENFGALYAKTRKDEDRELAIEALAGQLRALKRAGKEAEALTLLAERLKELPSELKGVGGRWRISRSAFQAGWERQLGQPVPAAQPRPPLQGTLAFAWQIPGESPQVATPPAGPADWLYVKTGTELRLVQVAHTCQELWRNAVGPAARIAAVGPTALLLISVDSLSAYDRFTGELLWRQKGPYALAALDEQYVVAGSENHLVGYDLATGGLLWKSWDQHRTRGQYYLDILDGTVVELFGGATYGRITGPLYVETHQARGGRLIKKEVVNEKVVWPRITVLPGGKQLALCADEVSLQGLSLPEGKVLWAQEKIGINCLALTRILPLDGGKPQLCFLAPLAWPNKNLEAHLFEQESGRRLATFTVQAPLLPVGGSFLQLSNAHLTRLNPGTQPDKLEKGWETNLNGRPHVTQTYPILSADRQRLYLFYPWQPHWENQTQLRCRVIEWATGKVWSDDPLPGAPIHHWDSGPGFGQGVRAVGDLVVFSTNEGLCAYSAWAGDQVAIAAQLKEQQRARAGTPLDALNRQRALATLEPSTYEAFIAPSDSAADGYLGEWQESEPLELEGAQNFMPVGPNPEWRGPEDLSARLYAGWNKAGIILALKIRDDVLVPPDPGAPRSRGDRIRIALNGFSIPDQGYDRRQLICTLALVQGKAALTLESEIREGLQVSLKSEIRPAPDGQGWQAELFVPWPFLRTDPRFRPGKLREILADVAIYDDDGQGVHGALEWGTALSDGPFAPSRLARLALLDISRERVEKYREVIAKIPGSEEGWRFLSLILASHRGVKAPGERARELEAFVTGNPACENTAKALLLMGAYVAQTGGEAQARIRAVAQAAKCPPHILEEALGQSFSVAVYNDPAKPAGMLMLQFNLRNKGWVRRAYWGTKMIWLPHAVEQAMGPLPKPGTWTQLEIPAALLDLSGEEIIGVTFTTCGGQAYWDEATATVAGQRRILLDDELPKNIAASGNALNFSDKVKKSGAKSWTSGPGPAALSLTLNEASGGTWFTLRNPKAPPPATLSDTQRQDLYRQVANLLPNSPEGLDFLNRALSLYKSPQQEQERIKEYETYLKNHPTSEFALTIMQTLYDLFGRVGETNPLGRCEELMKTCKLPQDAMRLFYSGYVPSWHKWQVLGPFPGTGLKRGLDQELEPELHEIVDLRWTTKGPGEIELGWKELVVDGKPRSKGNPNAMDLHEQLMAVLPQQARKELEDSSYFAYAYRAFTLQTSQRALLYFSVNDMISIWLNGQKVATEVTPGTQKDSGMKMVALRAGENIILVKAGVSSGRLSFQFRVSDLNGKPLPEVPND